MPGRNLFANDSPVKKGRNLFAEESTPGRGVEVSNADFDFSKMVENVPPSAGQLIKDMAYPAMHPMNTSQAIGNLIVGGVQKLIPGEQEKEKYPDALIEGLKGRLGSWDAIKQTLQNDPVGLASDLTGLGGLAKSLLKQAGKAGARAFPKDFPIDELESVMKFRTTLPEDQVVRMLNTQLDRQILPKQKGVKQLKASINKDSQLLDDLIDKAATRGDVDIDANIIFNKIEDLEKNLGGFKANAPGDLNIISNRVKQLKDYMLEKGINKVSLQELQAFKKDAWSRTKFDVEPGQGGYVNQQFSKSLGDAAKERLEQINPEVKKINQRLGRALELRPELERSTRRIGNRNLLGIDTPLKITAGGAAGGPVGAGLGAAVGLLRTPMNKARMAMLIHRLRGQGAKGQLRSLSPELALQQALTLGGRGGQNEELR